MLNYYDYKNAIRDDIINYVRENIDYIDKDIDIEEFYEELLNSDSITGNGSGSYWCNYWKAEDCINHNWDILQEALDNFGYIDINPIEKGAEWCDVIVRCYLLGECLNDVWYQVKDRLEEHEEQEALNE